MARADTAPEDRDREPLKLPAMIDCEQCETTYDFVFVCEEGVYEPEDVVDAPSAETTCPNCGHAQQEQWEGWTAHQDAG